jgi:type I restriction enzyme S subunit
VLIAGNGDLNVKYYNGKFDAYQRTYIIEDNSSGRLYMPYLYFFMLGYVGVLRKQAIGGVIKYIKLGNLTEALIELPAVEEQKKIVEILKKSQSVIEKEKKQIECFEDLIKARFVEMFGDLKSNTKGWKLSSFNEMTNLITDGEHSTPKRVTDGIFLLSARNVLNHSLQLDDVDYIDQTEYDRIAKRVIPQEGDVLISCSGSVGRCCAVPAGIKFQMVRSVALLRFKEMIDSTFAEYMITSDYLQEQINGAKTASSQANLFQGKIAKLRGFVPPLELQEQFATFVAQVDKSKVASQKALDETKLLFDSLMQEYFG